MVGILEDYLISKLIDQFVSKVRIWYYKLQGKKPPELQAKEKIEKLENNLEEKEKKEKQLLDLVEKREEKIKIKKDKLKEVRENLSVKERFIESVERKGISRKELIRKYSNEIPIIILNYGMSQPNGWIKDILKEKFNAVGISGGRVIPPDQIPEDLIKGEINIDEWLDKYLYEGRDDRKAAIAYATLADYRNTAWRKDIPNSGTYTIEDQLEQKIDISNYLSKKFYRLEEVTNSIEHIEKGDIGFLASKYLTKDELKNIHKNQQKIEKELGNPNLKELASKDIKQDLIENLNQYVSDTENVAEGIISQAELCKSILYEEDKKKIIPVQKQKSD